MKGYLPVCPGCWKEIDLKGGRLVQPTQIWHAECWEREHPNQPKPIFALRRVNDGQGHVSEIRLKFDGEAWEPVNETPLPPALRDFLS